MNKSCRTEKIQRECRSDGRTDCVCVCVCSYVKLRGVCVECVWFFSSLPFAVRVSSCISLMQAKEADDGGAHRWMTYRLCRLCHGDTSCKPPRSNMRPRLAAQTGGLSCDSRKKKGPVIKSLAGNVSQICHAATHFSSPSAFILKRLIKGVKRRLGGTDTRFFLFVFLQGALAQIAAPSPPPPCLSTPV